MQPDINKANISLLLTIDTYSIRSRYPANLNQAQPSLVDNGGMKIICAGAPNPVDGQGTPAIGFTANRGDLLFVRGISDTANAIDAVIIYNVQSRITPGASGPVFRKFAPDFITIRNSPVLDVELPMGLPPESQTVTYETWESKVRMKGMEIVTISFALYKLDDNQETQSLYGYFEWDAQITVK